MNNKGVKIFIAIMISFLVFPMSLNAKTISKGESDGNSSCPNAGNKCKSEVGINIKVSAYNFDATTSTTTIGDRTITITPNNSSAEYKAMMIIADEGKMDEIELNDTYSKKTIDELKTDLDDDVKIKTKKFTKSHTWQLKSGKEAMIVVWLKDKYTSNTCCKWNKDKDGNNTTCAEYLQCRAGNFELNSKDESSEGIKEIQIKGNSAFIYVQNPSSSGLVTNIKKTGNMCQNTWNGVFVNEKGERNESKKEFNIDAAEKTTWQTGLYAKFLSYCSQDFVAFNLSNSTIRKISNNMLKIYYYQKKLKNSGAKSISQVNAEIEKIKGDISTKYCNGDTKKCDNIITDANKLSNRSLSCDSKNLNDLQEEYLYIKKEKPIKTEKLSDGKTPTVCNVKCYEHLTVSYSPPQVVKAGLCFNYKITIKSITECGVEDKSEQVINGLKQKEMCNPIPICENSDSKTQAGPNEKFDECVNKCDGGKYTQSCINKCYNKVYKNNNSKRQSTVTKNANTNSNVKNMINNNLSLKGTKLATPTSDKCKEDDKCFKLYFMSDEVARDCRTDDIEDYVNNNKEDKLKNCAQYFMEAKLSNAKGKYVRRNSASEDYDWGQWKWNSDLNDVDMRVGQMSIPNSVGRASPFYFRDLSTSIETLKKLVLPSKDKQNGYWKKYNVNNNGILRQYSKRFKCNETCHYAGCSADSATSSKDYSEDLVDDLGKISDALKECSVTSACDTTEETSDFYINVNTKKGKNNESVDTKINGYNKIKDVNNNVTNVGNCPTSSCEKQSKPTMFVPLVNGNGNGILGLCYDNITKNPHYQTTITFPGSWINLKTGDVSYNCQELCTNRKKDQYYCTPYNSNDVNEEWAKWAINGYDSSKYPSNFTPEYNITSCLGGKLDDNGNCVEDGNGFGKYNWTVGFSCFYASYSKTIIIDDVKCYKNDSGEETECVDDTGKKLPEGKSTKLQDSYDIRVSDNASIFPQKNGKNRLRGYNWGSQAMLRSKDQTIQNTLESTGYGVDPVKYSRKVMEKGQDVYDDTAEVVITLSQSQMSDLKGEPLEIGTYSNRNYSGEYNNKVENIPGLYYYKMAGEFKNKYSITTNWTLGENSKTAKEAIR